jgi:hypothetical protein
MALTRPNPNSSRNSPSQNSKRRNASLRRGAVALIAAGVVAVVLNGCESQPKTKPSGSSAAPMAEPVQPMNRPAGASQTMQVVAGLLPLGTVPYDNMALPLVSPDGRFVAVQTGAPPTWPTALAEISADVPVATQLEVYELDLRENIEAQDRRAPALVTSLAEPALLGRSSDAEGFLIESPREDGSRWIGKAHWRTGEIEWLVTGADVNAFAAMGLGGRLAWSRRAVDAEQFELVVRNARGEEWSANTSGEHWLMPTWSGRGEGLYFLSLATDRLDLCYANAISAAAIRQSRQRLQLANQATAYTAYQTVIGQAGAIDGSLPQRDQLVFFHPGMQRVAVWRPLAPSGKQGIYLNAKSIAALVDQEDFAFVTMPAHLLRQNLRVTNERIELVGGIQVPRQTTSAAWPYLLLNPGEGQIGITAMRLLPREDAIFKSR